MTEPYKKSSNFFIFIKQSKILFSIIPILPLTKFRSLSLLEMISFC